MNIQIFGRSKCFDTKKAERYFKERRVKFQSVDLDRMGLSPRELQSVVSAVGGIEPLLHEKSEEAVLVRHLARREDQLEKLTETSKALRSPIVRNGRQATVGYCPEVWKDWE